MIVPFQSSLNPHQHLKVSLHSFSLSNRCGISLWFWFEFPKWCWALPLCAFLPSVYLLWWMYILIFCCYFLSYLFFDSRLVYNIKLASRIGQKVPSVQLSFLHTSVIFPFFCVCSYLYDSYVSKYALAVWSHFTQLLTYLLKIALINELNISHIILPRVIKLVH